jgi:hypothetical protein
MNPPPSILHVGFHKTATTWFQKEFYPSVTNARFVPRKTVQRALIEPRPLDFDARIALRILNGDDGKRLILCDEELSGNIHVGGLHGCATVEFARRLRETLPHAVVVLFQRKLVDHVASAYRQYVKKGGTRSPRRYVFAETHQHRRPTFSPAHVQAGPLARHYESLFGSESVHVFDFEDFVENPRGFLRRFARSFALSYDEDAIDWDRRANLGYGARTIALARMVNLLTARDVSEKYFLADVPGIYKASHRLLSWLNGFRVFRGPTSPSAVLGERVVGRLRNE